MQGLAARLATEVERERRRRGDVEERLRTVNARLAAVRAEVRGEVERGHRRKPATREEAARMTGGAAAHQGRNDRLLDRLLRTSARD